MQTTLAIEFIPNAKYRRSVEGADFSLEANTEAVPEEGQFFVLRRGKVLMKSRKFSPALEHYQALCREHWTKHLQSPDRRTRLRSAWGLVSLEPNHPQALEVLRVEGKPADRQQVEQMRRRKRFSRSYRSPRPERE